MNSWDPQLDDGLIDRLLNGDEPENLPSLVPISDGAFLLYAGQVHSVAGESGSGKSWLAMHAAAQVLTLPQGNVMYFDVETNKRRTFGRMLALGVDPQVLKTRFFYAHPTEDVTDTEFTLVTAPVREAVETGETVLAVIDSAGEGISLAGINPDSDEVANWIRRIPRALAEAGATVLLIDHVTKSSGSGKATFAIGSQRKRAAIDVQFMLDADLPFSKTQAGRARLRVSKDRDGNFSSNSVLAEMHVTPNAGQVAIELRGVQAVSETAAFDADENLKERLSLLVEVRGHQSSNELAKVIGANRPHVLDLIAWLVDHGYLFRDAPNKPLQSKRPFRSSTWESETVPDQPLYFDADELLRDIFSTTEKA